VNSGDYQSGKKKNPNILKTSDRPTARTAIPSPLSNTVGPKK